MSQTECGDALRFWACPNVNCVFDKRLESGDRCPLCGEEAKEFSSSELRELWKQKWAVEKSLREKDRRDALVRRLKYCPKCGSSNINVVVFYRPSIWKCLNCGYEGPIILENGSIAEKLREKFGETKKEEEHL